MCGIAGILDLGRSTSNQELEQRVLRMTDAIVHRGPDSSGRLVDAENGIALGHRRLAIVDLSPTGVQPMRSASGRFECVFNGEIYDHRRIRSRLEGVGSRFRGTSDTEVLLEAIERWGLETALADADGMFAFALWDRQERLVHLARDRFGEKPLYWTATGGEVLFGSELKALMADPSVERSVDRDVLARYLMANCVPGGRSILSGVQQVPPGSVVTVDLDSRTVGEPKAWWSAIEAAQRAMADPLRVSGAEAVDLLHAVLAESVADRMMADVPLGAFLSGGLDSSLIVSLMVEASSAPVRTFTIGFDSAVHDEADHARAVAEHLGTDHTELTLGPDEIRSVVPTLPTMFDEPFGDSSQIPTHLVARMAREHVTVALSGDAGDELFAGYNRYRYVPELASRLERVPAGVRRGAGRALGAVPPSVWERAVRPLPERRRPQIPANKARKLARVLDATSPSDIYRRLITHWDDAHQLVLGASPDPWIAHQPDQWPDLDGIVRQMQVIDTVTYLPDDILTKVDRAAMAVSLETRVPFLHEGVYELAHRIPTAQHLVGTQGKVVLRSLLHRFVPPSLVDRPKSGFSVPIASWLRGDLRSWARDLLDRDRLLAEGFFDPDPIVATFDSHLAGTVDAEHELWDVLMFQAWHEHWLA